MSECGLVTVGEIRDKIEEVLRLRMDELIGLRVVDYQEVTVEEDPAHPGRQVITYSWPVALAHMMAVEFNDPVGCRR